MQYQIKEGTRPGALEVYFSGKPNEEIRTSLKSASFRWNKSKSCWYGFITEEELKAVIESPASVQVPNNAINYEALKEFYTEDTTDKDGYMGGSASTGSKSRQHLYGAELSKAIREALKKCNVVGVTVKSKTFSMGQSITATIKVSAADVISEEEYIRSWSTSNCNWIYYKDENGEHHDILAENYYSLSAEEQGRIAKLAASTEYGYFMQRACGQYGEDLHNCKDFIKSEELKKKIEAVKQIVNSFNYDHSNGMVDYFDTNFYADYVIKLAC